MYEVYHTFISYRFCYSKIGEGGYILVYNMAHIELTNQCNLNCKMCKVHNGNTIMDFDRFQEILRQLVDLNKNGGNIRNIELNGFGEALLHPRLLEAIKFTKRHFPHVSLVTNGTLLNTELSRSLLLSDIDKITVSITGSNIDIYSNFQGYQSQSNLFYKVLDNVKSLIELKNKLHSQTDICVSYILTAENMKDLRHYIKYWKKNGINRIFVNPMIQPTFSQRYRRCFQIGNKIFINSNGDIRPCCYDFARKLTIGNVWESHSSIRNILTQSKQTRLVYINKNCKFHMMPDLCKNCVLLNRFSLIHAYRFRIRIIYNKGFFDTIKGYLFETGIFLYSCLPNNRTIYQIMDKIKVYGILYNENTSFEKFNAKILDYYQTECLYSLYY